MKNFQKKVYENLIEAAKKYNVEIEKPKGFVKLEEKLNPKFFREIFKKYGKPKIAFFFVSKKKSIYYAKIKQLLNKKNILSQFFKSFNKKSDEKNLSKYNGLVVQMSSKLGGCPWGLKTTFKTTILMGADVFHQKTKKSVASLVSMFGKDLS